MIQLKNIKKNYLPGENVVYALKGVSVTFRESEFVSVLGQSGCGKTTLLNIIGGLDQYNDGDLIINGRSTKEYKDRDWDSYRNHSVGFVFQSYNLIPHQTVLQNVEIALTLSGVSGKERRERAIKALSEVGLADQLHKRPKEMSGGQMQRVAIARALVNDPDIILADEPTGALDTETSVQVMEILKKIAFDRLVVMVTHNPDLAEKYSTRIIRMLDGVITDDTKPVTEAEEAEMLAKIKKEQASKTQKKREKKPSMSFFTSLNLSLKNLFTKKGRTLLTSFAGSIGVIGIALVLSVSQGMTAYINAVQEESLSSYPLQIEQQNVNLQSLVESFTKAAKAEEHENDRIYEKAVLYSMIDGIVNTEVAENDLKAFKKYLDKEYSDENSMLSNAVSGLAYGYNLDLQVYTKTDEGILKSDLALLLRNMMGQYMADGAAVDGNPFMLSMMNRNSRLTLWEEMLPGRNGDPVNDTIKQQYELVYGTWPNSSNEVLLVLDKNNELTDMTLYALGLKPEQEIKDIVQAVLRKEKLPERKSLTVSYEDICSREYRVILNADSFILNKMTNTYVDNRNTDAGIEYLYSEKGFPLKVTGIIRVKKDVNSPMLSGSIVYTKMLTEDVIKRAESSPAVIAQLKDSNIDIFSGLPFKSNSYTVSEKAEAFKKYVSSLDTKGKAGVYVKVNGIIPDDMLSVQVETALKDKTREDMESTMLSALKTQLDMSEDMLEGYIKNMTDDEIKAYFRQIVEAGVKAGYAASVVKKFSAVDENTLSGMLDSALPGYTEEMLGRYYDETLEFSTSTYDDNLVKLGSIDIENPSSIGIYASSFKDKDTIIDEIEKYNESVDEASKISYTDYMGILMSAVTTIINAITYVLIAFVAISLIVSSIMIAVITLISVQERTKEIGILRAIGASKRNVSGMFNAETIIIGLASGVLGIAVSYLLLIPINLILHNLTHIGNLSAVLPIKGALILIAISVLLTLISGFIPSRAAAKKDPVVALRSE